MHLPCALEFSCRGTMTVVNAYALDHRPQWGRWVCLLLWYEGPTVEHPEGDPYRGPRAIQPDLVHPQGRTPWCGNRRPKLTPLVL